MDRLFTTIFLLFLLCSGACRSVNSSDDREPASEPVQRDDFAATRRLLAGKWQHVEDSSNYLVFDDRFRKELVAAAGMEEWEIDSYVLTYACDSADDPTTNDDNNAAAVYIYCELINMCWHILSLNDKILTLSYAEKGNTLTYRHVKE